MELRLMLRTSSKHRSCCKLVSVSWASSSSSLALNRPWRLLRRLLATVEKISMKIVPYIFTIFLTSFLIFFVSKYSKKAWKFWQIVAEDVFFFKFHIQNCEVLGNQIFLLWEAGLLNPLRVPLHRRELRRLRDEDLRRRRFCSKCEDKAERKVWELMVPGWPASLKALCTCMTVWPQLWNWIDRIFLPTLLCWYEINLIWFWPSAFSEYEKSNSETA